MMSYKLTEVEANLEVKAKVEADPHVPLGTANIVVRATIKAIVPFMVKNANVTAVPSWAPSWLPHHLF